MDELIKTVEALGAEANKTMAGADYIQIVRDVAAEHGVDSEDLRQACLDAWLGLAG